MCARDGIMAVWRKPAQDLKIYSLFPAILGWWSPKKWSKKLGKCVGVFSERVRMQQPLLGTGIAPSLLIIPLWTLPEGCSALPILVFNTPRTSLTLSYWSFHHWELELGLQPELSFRIFYFPLWVMRKVHKPIEFPGFPCSALLGHRFNNLDCTRVRGAWWQSGYILCNCHWNIFFLDNSWTWDHRVFVSTLLGELWGAPDVFLEGISKRHWQLYCCWRELGSIPGMGLEGWWNCNNTALRLKSKSGSLCYILDEHF